jgi:replicative DNA helicase Mcm
MEREQILEKFSEFLRDFYYDELIAAVSENKKSIEIDFSLFDKFDTEVSDYTLENPEEVLAIAEDAVEQIDLAGKPRLKIRFFNLPENKQIRIRNIRSEHIGKLISVDGMVRRASEIRPEVSEAIFTCPECDNRITEIQTERIIRPPFECDKCSCKRGFKLVDQKLYDARWVAIEEPFEITTGERPSEIMIFLKEDLTTTRMQNKTEPGNRIKTVGILKQIPKRVKGTRSRQMEIYIDANHVENVEMEWEELELTPDDEKKIIELARSPDIYDKLSRSIAPTLYGMQEVKEAIVLQLFGGEQHIQKDKSRVRGVIHLLLVGDPSTAKSVIMKVASGLIPRGRYVSGKGVTGAGLTATVVRDEEFLGGWVLEAGALVMCNRSMLAIDEFEKIDISDQVALHEAMEQNTISIAKANIIATLPAQTSILAGGNPKFGRFDPYLPIKEQITVPETLLSRFDIKFAMRDLPNPEIDRMIADHILQTRHYGAEDVVIEIDNDLLKKYVAYSRKNYHPQLSRESGEALKEFFVKLREKVTTEESPVPITLRQYEALIRLTEASAKIQLRNITNKEDSLRAINLMKASLRQFGFDPETGKIDIDRVEGHVTSTQRSRIRIVLDIINDLAKVFGKEIPTEEVVKEAQKQGVIEISSIIEQMRDEGLLIEPKPNFIQKI